MILRCNCGEIHGQAEPLEMSNVVERTCRGCELFVTTFVLKNVALLGGLPGLPRVVIEAHDDYLDTLRAVCKGLQKQQEAV